MIAEQGTFNELNSTGGYVSTFTLPPPDWDYKPEDVISSAQTYEHIPSNPNQITDSLEAEANRRTGDVSIYLYYVRSIGWLPTSIFIVAMTAFIFCMSFPREYSHPNFSDYRANFC
jgi:ATP-binding cassette, subfamily C (CFTR/MRP), member 1